MEGASSWTSRAELNMAKVVASIEARMGSSRLPGKVLADIGGKPALTRLLERRRRCRHLDAVVLATSTNPDDDKLAQWADEQSIPCHRGSEDDVLRRVVEAHRKTRSDVVVEVTGDCPLLDPDLLDMGIEMFHANECDVVSNVHPVSYPQGVDVQVFKFAALETIEQRIDDAAVREHVSLYFYENPDKYRILALISPRRWHAPNYRFQLDYPEDLAFIRAVYDRLEPAHGGADFGVEEILALIRSEPALLRINENCEEKPAR